MGKVRFNVKVILDLSSEIFYQQIFRNHTITIDNIFY